MKDLFIEISNWERELEKWGRREEVYAQGVKIAERYMPNSRLLNLLRRAKRPNSKHWGHLEYQLRKLKPAKSSHGSKVKAKPVKAITQQEASSAPVTVQLGSDVVDQITSEIRQAATERALLSNQLVNPGDDPVLIQKNCDILDRIEPVMQKIKDLEARRNDIKAGKVSLAEENPEADRIVVSRKGEDYSLNDLYKIEMHELQALKTRLTIDISKAKGRMKILKTEKGKTSAAEQIKRSEIMKLVVQKVIVERKALEIAE